jgi:hypothetical protein
MCYSLRMINPFYNQATPVQPDQKSLLVNAFSADLDGPMDCARPKPSLSK